MKRLTVAVMAVFFSAVASAGGTAVIGTDHASEQVTLEYADGKIRLGAEQQGDNYIIVEGDKVYAVTYENGRPVVLDLAAMGKMLGAVGGTAGQLPLQMGRQIGEILELRSLGRNETLAGITGQLHELVYLDAEGDRQTEEVVLSTDPAVCELTQVMLQLSRVLVTILGQPVDPLDALERILQNGRQGLLRIGSEVRLASLSTKTPAVERFVLPAQPGSMPNLGVLMQEAARKIPEAWEALDDFMNKLEELGNR